MEISSKQIKKENLDFKVEPIINPYNEEKYITIYESNSLINNISRIKENLSTDNILNDSKNLSENFININENINSNILSQNNERIDNRKKNKNTFLGKKRNNKKKKANSHKKLIDSKKKNKDNNSILRNLITTQNQDKKSERNLSQNSGDQIINNFQITENKSEKTNHGESNKNKSSEMEELNTSWINYINEVISKSNINNENKSNEKEDEKKLPISLNIKDSLNFSFSSFSKEKNIKKDSHNYIDASYPNKKEKYLSIPNVNSSNELCKIKDNSKKEIEINDRNNN